MNVLPNEEKLAFLFDVDVVSLEELLLDVWYFVADEDIHHGFELDIMYSVEGGLSVGCHDDFVNEGIFYLVSLLLLIFAWVILKEIVYDFEDGLFSNNLAGSINSQVSSSF